MKAKVLSTLVALFSSKPAAAAAGGGVTAALLSPIFHEVLPTLVGVGGAVVAHTKKPANSKLEALTNGGVSAVLGGAGAPALSQLLAYYYNFPQSLAITVMLSLILSASWPWVAPQVYTGVSEIWRAIVDAIVARFRNKTP